MRPLQRISRHWYFPPIEVISILLPALEVPEGLILARSTADPPTLARRQREIRKPRFGRLIGDWVLMQGGLVTSTNPVRDLPSIGRLEECSSPAASACTNEQ